jgi:hypothetical protein
MREHSSIETPSRTPAIATAPGAGCGGVLRLRNLAIAAAGAAIAVAAVSAFAADLVIFGPETFHRAVGKPVAETRIFRNVGPTGGFTLRVVNRGVTSGVVSINGQRVLTPDDFDVSSRRRVKRGASEVVSLFERPLKLRTGDNELVVELHGKSGTSLTVEIVRAAPNATDTTPPIIAASATPGPNANGWNNGNVTVTFACSDAGSGIATCPDPVPVTSEGANQIVSGTATDKAGNTATASIALNIDKTPPVVTPAVSPEANANGWNNSDVTVSFTAIDALSGIAPGSVTLPVMLAADGTNVSATGSATDVTARRSIRVSRRAGDGALHL